MSSTTENVANKPSKSMGQACAAQTVAHQSILDQPLTGKALLADMKAYGKQVSASPEGARDFLTRLGVMTPSGKVKTLIRG